VPVFVLACGIDAAAGSDNQQTSVEERAKGAKKVVVAKATQVIGSFQANEQGDQLIVSQVVLQVEETLKGPRSSYLSVQVEGGTVGGLTLRVSDLPQMKTGDRAVFFLNETQDGSHVPHRRGLGIMHLDKDKVRGTNLTVSTVRQSVKNAK
jgi:hypothetical protein